MAYTKTTWTDRAVQYPNRYDKSEESESQLTLVPSPGAVTQTGTPINATNMNKIEQGIADAIPKGSVNSEIANLFSILNEVDTRSVVITRDSTNLVSKVEEKDGSTVLRTTVINRINGLVTSVVLTCNGKTITLTVNRDTSGLPTSVTKTVT